MGIFQDLAIKLLGPAPEGYQVLEYAFSGVIAIFFIKSFFSLIYMFVPKKIMKGG